MRDIADIPRHPFKCTDWLQRFSRVDHHNLPVFVCAIRSCDLIAAICDYQEYYHSIETEQDILHMLTLHTHLYGTKEPQECHIRTIATLIRELESALDSSGAASESIVEGGEKEE